MSHRPTRHPLITVHADSHTVTRRWKNPIGPLPHHPTTWPAIRRFVGGEVNTHTDLVRLGTCDYDPSTGLIASVDPILEPRQACLEN